MATVRVERRTAPMVALALLACLAAGGTVAVRAPAAPLVAIAAAFALAALDWRRGVVLLLIVLPFSGVPVFMAGEAGLAARDLFIVAPLYVAFALWATTSEKTILPRMGVALPALLAFAAVVAIHVALAPSLAVGALGAKVWLAYLPMLAIGYAFVRTRGDFESVIKLTALLGLVPAIIAIAEWALASRHPQTGVWANDFGPLRLMYGSWFEQVRGNGLAVTLGDGRFVVPRVPSTFTSSTQFYVFSMVACAAGLSQALRSGNWRWIVCAGVLAAGVMASGERQAYITMPLLVAASIALAAPRAKYLAGLAIIGAIGIAAVVAVEPAPTSVLRALPSHARAEIVTASREMRESAGTGIVGHGTGWDTQAALRYGGSASKRYVENWYAKAALELGFAGLATIVLALASLQWRLFDALRRIEPGARRTAAPICVALLLMTATLFKGPVLDVDPLNVYFWLLIGMLLAYVQLSRRDVETEAVAA